MQRLAFQGGEWDFARAVKSKAANSKFARRIGTEVRRRLAVTGMAFTASNILASASEARRSRLVMVALPRTALRPAA
jgi:hypothetical protein